MSSELILYQTEDGQTKIQTRLENETIWLTQDQMALLFGKAKSTINEHIKNVYEEKELEGSTILQKFENSEFLQKAHHCTSYRQSLKNELSKVEHHFAKHLEHSTKRLKKKNNGN